MAFLPRYYLGRHFRDRVPDRRSSPVFSRPLRRQQFGDAPHRALPIGPPAAANKWQRDVINSATGAFSGVEGPVPPSGLRGEHWVVLEFRHTFADRTRWSAETFSPAPPGNVAVVVMSAVGIVVAPWEKLQRRQGRVRRYLARIECQMNIRDPEASKRKWPEPKSRPSLNREASRLGDVRVRRPSSRAQVPETCRDQSIASRERWTFERSSTSRNFFWLVCKNCNSLRKLCCVASAEPSFRDFAQ